ncbi:MAG TPA: VOC family protein [Acidimicrobiales bacterium]|nr:VOC family protein [Acidimicrobiales bacterium]
MLTVTPFLLFDGTCAEAMRFYQSCLGGQLDVTLVGDTPMRDQAPPEHHAKVAYAHLVSEAIELSATDWQHQTRAPKVGNTVGLYLTGGRCDELREAFDKLSVGADAGLLDELRQMPFGTYGHLADKFGVHWFFRGE